MRGDTTTQAALFKDLFDKLVVARFDFVTDQSATLLPQLSQI